MRCNQNTVIEDSIVNLVPYRKEHVLQYNQWMSDPFLQETTESEPLSLDEEYDMQRSWSEDEDKCTFIILDCSLPDTPGTGQHGGRMAGDVNLFFNDPDERATAEIEVMVAEEQSRRKGISKRALQLFMAYAHTQLGVTLFRAKILESNSPSISLFSSLGYIEAKRVAVFKEVYMEYKVDTKEAIALQETAKAMVFKQYDQE
ncbi:hypothetical protein CEUSTIGMA_g10408.t1 [Chlamydomonas eustigma]|uniref:N-acetyltransferase domain-containing protein n=1 Tax=Chlamydomonas eustigma TaxID=1157962 RepID=A0A250XIS0_9CHLO|nr:hypothetical protein CEUSTIGMA_g10408.t1 [Chlamydomonas eustigma]|eukprot:GAX82981.1 hypothetical protein CEUSTIGMA_g10408.t1 [Chlamydomonas eustigma]